MKTLSQIHFVTCDCLGKMSVQRLQNGQCGEIDRQCISTVNANGLQMGMKRLTRKNHSLLHEQTMTHKQDVGGVTMVQVLELHTV